MIYKKGVDNFEMVHKYVKFLFRMQFLLKVPLTDYILCPMTARQPSVTRMLVANTAFFAKSVTSIKC